MARSEYYDDPAAPAPNSLVVGTAAVITDAHGRILLQRRSDNGLWALPGGGMEMTESVPAAVVREVKEETGFDVEVTGLIGIYTDPRHIIAYTDGEVRRQFAIVMTARITGGQLRGSIESTEVAFVEPHDLDALPMHATQRLRLQHYLNDTSPYIG